VVRRLFFSVGRSGRGLPEDEREWSKTPVEHD
jgi:hypothetical protein